jgi:hypothetical protein
LRRGVSLNLSDISIFFNQFYRKVIIDHEASWKILDAGQGELGKN